MLKLIFISVFLTAASAAPQAPDVSMQSNTDAASDQEVLFASNTSMQTFQSKYDFEETIAKVKQFIEEIIGVANLREFREQYQQKYSVLKTSYEKERRTLEQCKKKINEIWENSQNVRSAIRLANQEVDKIQEIKKAVDDETAKAEGRREEEKGKLQRIELLKEEIKEAERKNAQAQELEEETELRLLK